MSRSIPSVLAVARELDRIVAKPTPSTASDEDMLDDLVDLALDLGRTPTQDDMDRLGPFDHRTYARRFGSWTKACRRVGLTPNVRGRSAQPLPDGFGGNGAGP